MRKHVEGLRRSYRAQTGRDLTDDEIKRQLAAYERSIKEIDEDIPKAQEKLAAVRKELDAAESDDRALEDRRLTDVEAKLRRTADECDLLIVPRQTIINIHSNNSIFPRAHALSDADDLGKPASGMARQIRVVRDFMKKGKPVLACVGPTNEKAGGAPGEPLDDFERLLADRGVELGKQTVLYLTEETDFSDDESEDSFGAGGRAVIPPLEFRGPQPIARAMVATGKAVEQQLDIRLRHPRPVYPAKGSRSVEEFAFTTAEAWNEEKPFPQFRSIGGGLAVRVYTPRFQATPEADARKGTRDEERKGPFPVAVAVAAPCPVEWYESEKREEKAFVAAESVASLLAGRDLGLTAALTSAAALVEPDPAGKGEVRLQTSRKPARLVAFGHGGVFAGQKLNPSTERLLLNSCNWLLDRDDRLPKTDAVWSYPRVGLTDSEKFLWHWGRSSACRPRSPTSACWC